MEILAILLQPHVMVVIAISVVMAALLPHRRARARSEALASRSPAMAELAKTLDGSLSGQGQAGAWSPRLQRSKPEAELSLDFRHGPWHVRVTEACNPKPRFTEALLEYEHCIEIATMVPPRKMRLEFFSLSFEDGFVHTVCQGQVRPDELVFLVDMILETLDLMPGVEPRDPTAVV